MGSYDKWAVIAEYIVHAHVSFMLGTVLVLLHVTNVRI